MPKGIMNKLADLYQSFMSLWLNVKALGRQNGIKSALNKIKSYYYFCTN